MPNIKLHFIFSNRCLKPTFLAILWHWANWASPRPSPSSSVHNKKKKSLDMACSLIRPNWLRGKIWSILKQMTLNISLLAKPSTRSNKRAILIGVKNATPSTISNIYNLITKKPNMALALWKI